MKNKIIKYDRGTNKTKKCYRKTCIICGKGRWVGYYSMMKKENNCCPSCSRLLTIVENQKVVPPKNFYKKVECGQCTNIFFVEKKTLYRYIKNHKLKKYLCHECLLKNIKKNAEKEKQKEIEFLKTLTVIKKNKKKDLIPKLKKITFNGCGWQEEPYIERLLAISKRCEKWDICEKKEQCLNKLCELNWKSFTADCKGFHCRL